MNMSLAAWINPGWIVQTLVASAVLMVLVLVARGPVRRAFGANVAYALWALPALRMVLPSLPGWRTLGIPVLYLSRHESTIGYVDPATAVRLADAGPIVPQAVLHLPVSVPVPAPELLAAAPPPTAVDWPLIAVAIWLGGAALVFAVQILRYHLFLRRILADATPLSRECGIDVLVSGKLSGPIAAGIVHRRILLPTDFVRRYTSAERRLALKHEAAHHDRRDIVANLVASAVVALHWWNPLARKAYCAFRADQELACDATVLADAQAADRHTYGSAMLKSASGHMPAMACALSHKEQLKQKIMMMARSPIGRLRLGAGVALAAGTVVGGLLLTASGAALAANPVPPVPPIVPTAVVAPVAAPAVVVIDDRKHHRVVTVTDPRHLGTADRRAYDRAVAEAYRSAEIGRREAEYGRREAERAMLEAQREGRRAALEGQRERDQALREADRERQQAFAEGRREADAARREADHERRQAALETRRVAMPDVQAMVRTSLDQSRAAMAARCAAEGNPMPAGSDFGAVAGCGVKKMIVSSLRQARATILQDRNLTPDQRAHALAGLDRSIAANERRLADD